MIKNIKNILVTSVILVFSANILFADGNKSLPPSKDNGGGFKKNKFSNSSSWNNRSGGAKTVGPPNPGGGDGGSSIPISGGLAFLLVGSLTYLGKKVINENK